VPAWTAEFQDAPMKSDTVESKATAADNAEPGIAKVADTLK
jgi:hypothetical protein